MSVTLKSPDSGSFVVEEVKVRTGAWVHKSQLLMTLRPVKEGGGDVPKSSWIRLRAPSSGKISAVHFARKDVAKSSVDVVQISASECSHPTIMKKMCADCGMDLQREDAFFDEAKSSASIAVLHSIPELKVSSDEALSLGREDERRLLKHRRLVLLVDLDQTLIHTTNENIPPNLKDVYHFQLYGSQSPWYHTRIRPKTAEFLENVSKFYELHICTFGARLYAHTIAKFLDKDSKFFSHRILSRDECFDSRSKTANLSSLFPCGDHMVCIIDDREDVWNYAPNLVHVKPYIFFRNTGDINAPPGSPKVPTAPSPSKETSRKYSQTSKVQRPPEPKTSEPPATERRDSIDMPTIDEGLTSEARGDDVATKDADAMSAVSDDLELSEDSSGSSSEGASRSTPAYDPEEAEEKTEEEGKVDDSDSSEKSGMDDDAADDLAKEGAAAAEKVEDDLIEMEDSDDYLLYLEDNLKRIHEQYYKAYDDALKKGSKTAAAPDLKQIIPGVKRRALRGTVIVFSGVVPNHVPQEKSKAFLVARSLGAKVADKVSQETTHLVAARVGTAKVNEVRKRLAKSCYIVTPDWLWCCAERWERIEERLYPLCKSAPVTIQPPAHCSSPEDNAADRIPDIKLDDEDEDTLTELPSKRSPERQTSKESLPETLNPFFAFSSEDLKGMDKEVEDNLSNESLSSSSGTNGEEGPSEARSGSTDEENVAVGEVKQVELSESSSSSSDDSMTAEYPRGLKRKRLREEGGGEGSVVLHDGDPLERFRRGEEIPDADFEIAAQSDDEDEDRSMAAELEREFLQDCNSNSNL